MTLILPHIRLALTVALLLAIAPVCVSAVACSSCDEPVCFADEHVMPGEVSKRPSLPGTTPAGFSAAVPAFAFRAALPRRTLCRYLPPGPMAALRI